MGCRAYYEHLQRLLDELSIGRADARHKNLLKQLAKINVLVIHNWGWQCSTTRIGAIYWECSTTAMAAALPERQITHHTVMLQIP